MKNKILKFYQGGKCPECGEYTFDRDEGKCTSCGYSEYDVRD